FIGKAMKGGELVPMGTKVAAWIAGYASPLGEITTFVPNSPSGSNYVVQVDQYGTILNEASSLMFHIGGQDTGQVHAWEEGAAHILNLAIN
ncbi:uncharacterized protein METZ01_LOCUS356703, partial [marine metagenome]